MGSDALFWNAGLVSFMSDRCCVRNQGVRILGLTQLSNSNDGQYEQNKKHNSANGSFHMSLSIARL